MSTREPRNLGPTSNVPVQNSFNTPVKLTRLISTLQNHLLPRRVPVGVGAQHLGGRHHDREASFRDEILIECGAKRFAHIGLIVEP